MNLKSVKLKMGKEKTTRIDILKTFSHRIMIGGKTRMTIFSGFFPWISVVNIIGQHRLSKHLSRYKHLSCLIRIYDLERF